MTTTATLTTRALVTLGASRRQRGRGERDGLAPYLYLLPGFLAYGAFVLIPIAETLRLSFFRWDGLLPEVWIGATNYEMLLANPRTWAAFGVSAVFILFGCLLPVAVALLLAGVIARTRIRGLSFFRFVFFLPYTIALAVVAIAWRWLYAADGTVNQLIDTMFGAGAAVAVLGDFTLALPSVGIVAFWATFGFVTVLLLSGVQAIPKELYEAARVDGAGAIREFFTVTVPGIRHELRVSLVMTFVMAMRTFDLPLMTTQGGPGYATTSPSLMMYRDVFMNSQIGRGAALAMLITLVTFVGVLVINRVLVRKD